ncbi:hypothetical protein ACI2KR_26955 [Pseudomonas luteola]
MNLLADSLGIAYNDETFKSLGMIDDSMRLQLLSMCDQQATNEFSLKHGWQPDQADFNFHPNGKNTPAMAASWWTCNDFDREKFFEPILPNANLDALHSMFLAADYTGAHDDEHLNQDKANGIVAVLLDAPLGCNLLHSENQLYNMHVGEVVMMDDLLLHGVYPLQATKAFDIEQYRLDHEKRMSLYTEECMKFLLMGLYFE